MKLVLAVAAVWLVVACAAAVGIGWILRFCDEQDRGFDWQEDEEPFL